MIFCRQKTQAGGIGRAGGRFWPLSSPAAPYMATHYIFNFLKNLKIFKTFMRINCSLQFHIPSQVADLEKNHGSSRHLPKSNHLRNNPRFKQSSRYGKVP